MSKKKVRVQTANQFLKIIPKFNQKQFANIVTAIETCVHFFRT